MFNNILVFFFLFHYYRIYMSLGFKRLLEETNQNKSKIGDGLCYKSDLMQKIYNITWISF